MRREQGLKSTEEGGTEWPTATSPAMDGSMVMGVRVEEKKEMHF